MSRGNGPLTFISGSNHCVDCPGCGQAARVDRRGGQQLTFTCYGQCGADIAGLLGAERFEQILSELAVGRIVAETPVIEPTLGAVPDYPLGALPEPARKLVEHGEASCLPAALLGGGALGALAAAIGPRAQIEVTGSWHERAIVWVPLLAPRGAGKSPALDLAFDPLRKHDEQLEEDDDGEPILLGDQTLEALARRLHAAGGAGALELDELAVLLRGLGEYKRGGGGDRGRVLQLWKGSPWNFSRVGAGGKKTNEVELRIGRPTLVICGGLQPALHELLGGEEDGMRPRWLPHLAEMPQQLRLGRDRHPADWQLLLGGELLPSRDTDRTWRLAADGRATFEQRREAWKRQAQELETASTAAALNKADVHLARVTLILAEAQRPGTGGDIGAELVERAAAIVAFTLDCWRALPEQGTLTLTRRDGELDRAITRLIAWLEEHKGSASKRELQRACVAGARTAAELDALLARYEAIYPGSVSEARPDHGGLPTLIVRAPTRSAISTVSAPADTVIRADGNPHSTAESGGVGSADTAPADTAIADTAPSAQVEQLELDATAAEGVAEASGDISDEETAERVDWLADRLNEGSSP